MSTAHAVPDDSEAADTQGAGLDFFDPLHAWEDDTQVADASRILPKFRPPEDRASRLTQALGVGAGRFASVNGLKMYYEAHGAHGTGSPLVLLHGGSATIESSFGSVLPALAKSRQVFAVEQQGHGHTPDIARPLSYEQMADDTARLLGLLKVESADLLGWSDGANVALQVAIRHPSLVRKLIVSGANYSNDGIDPEAMQWLRATTPENWPREFQMAYARAAPDPKQWPTLVSKLKKMWLEFKGWRPEDIQRIEAPVLVMVGDGDMVRPEHAVKMFRLLAYGQLAVLPATGHRTLQQRPAWVLSMIAAFLEAPLPDAK